jgi:poly(3-hydroxybutyrate) depolymerase
MAFRHASTLALTCLIGTLLWPPTSRADHDHVPDPPPRTISQKLQAIPKLDRTAVTVSGLSSGGFFAHQFHIAFSKLVTGAGIIAGGPFGCVESIPNPYVWFWTLDRVSAATVACSHYYGDRYYGLRPSPPKADDSVRLIRDAWRQHAIDDPANLAGHKVWLFHGRSDDVVPSGVESVVKQVYEAFGLREPSLRSDFNASGPSANHGMPVSRFAGASKFPVRTCGEHAPPFVIQCGFEAAELLLRHFYPDNFSDASDDPHRDGTLIAFDQTEFFDPRDGSASLHGVGYVYVPRKCAEESCRLHVAFHGCNQDVDSIQDDFFRDAGYNRWAATNNIVVLYPQTTQALANPNRCWDFWGYTGLNYYTQQGTQTRAVKAMVNRLTGSP